MMMVVEPDRSVSDEPGREVWLGLLATATLGRVALSSGALPTVLPVAFRLDGDRIVIRSRPGSKLDAATRNSVVAFQTDAFDPGDHSGWSVEVTGVANAVTDPLEAARLSSLLPSTPSSPGESCIVAISTELVSGQRFLPTRVAS